jgi:hypothetical protein
MFDTNQNKAKKRLTKALATHKCQLTEAGRKLILEQITKLNPEKFYDYDLSSCFAGGDENGISARKKMLQARFSNLRKELLPRPVVDSSSGERPSELTKDQARHVAICCLYGDELPSARLFNLIGKSAPIIALGIVVFVPVGGCFFPICWPAALFISGLALAFLGSAFLVLLVSLFLEVFSNGAASVRLFGTMADEEKRLRIQIADDAKKQVTKSGAGIKVMHPELAQTARPINGAPGADFDENSDKRPRNGYLDFFQKQAQRNRRSEGLEFISCVIS